MVEGDLFQLVIRDWNVEAVTEVTNGFNIHLLDVVGNVLAFTGITQTITFHCLGQDHGWTTLGLLGFIERGVNFHRIVTTAVQAPDVIV